MRLSPFGPPRSEPRRPDIDDMRPVTRQALVTMGFVPLGIGVLGWLSQHDARSFFAGLVFASAFVVVAYGRSIAFEGKHLSESREFWRNREAFVRPRFFVGSLAVFVAGALTAIVAAVGSRLDVAGFLVAPVLMAGVFVLLLWGKVP